jgi:subtilisin family serine protease
MRTLRKPLLAGALAAAAFGVVQSAPAGDQPAREYVVVYESDASGAAARDAVEDAGGTIVSENSKVGVATVRSSESDFVRQAGAEQALVGAAANKPIGKGDPGPKKEIPGAADEGRRGASQKAPEEAPQGDPLGADQWDMKMIGATPEHSYKTQPGSKDVLVGIIDTGVDGSHPDLAPNFVKSLSRNFTTDMPDIDGPCEVEDCKDPADVDEGGHGTHVAGTVGAALNGIGVAGVAPKTGIVNLRAGQDSGYFFLKPSVDALTYAGDNGIDVVNMSYYIDPWLYNCTANPADSAEAQAQQKVIIEATQRALHYAHDRGVTLIAAAGNQDDDLGDPEPESSSPDYPAGANYERDATDDCLSLPTEGDNVLSITALGPSKRKSFYSNYGISGADLSAPGGDSRDTGDPAYPPLYKSQILSTYPAAVAKAELARPTTNPAQYATDGQSYWKRIQGTSMASPHATGVAALVVAEEGRHDPKHGGLTLKPAKVERIMRAQATDTACPEPRLFDYPEPISGDQYTAYCEGTPDRNGFYGDGIVDAGAVGAKR